MIIAILLCAVLYTLGSSHLSIIQCPLPFSAFAYALCSDLNTPPLLLPKYSHSQIA